MRISNFTKHMPSDRSDFTPASANNKTAVTAAVVGGATLTGALIGGKLGAAHEAKDMVTIEQVPYRETVRVRTGTRTQFGCFRMKYDGEYGYDPTCIKRVPEYETRYTGRILHREVKHHTVSRPYTMWGGALMGAGVGLAVGVAGALAANAIMDH